MFEAPTSVATFSSALQTLRCSGVRFQSSLARISPRPVRLVSHASFRDGRRPTFFSRLQSSLFFLICSNLSGCENAPGSDSHACGHDRMFSSERDLRDRQRITVRTFRAGHWYNITFEIPLHDVPEPLVYAKRRLPHAPGVCVRFRYDPCRCVRNTLGSIEIDFGHQLNRVAKPNAQGTALCRRRQGYASHS